ncbi:MAG: PEP-CTERM sorting domain-containing protein [Kiritimatiellae bacterium]|nr:PEP-CTERM sorting domain-containing protein [Kiritimatiellia bacterium]
MKKLMVIAVVAFTAVAASASNMKWGLLSGTLDTTKVDKGTAYLCYYTGDTSSWGTSLAALTSYDQSTITSTMGMQLVKIAADATTASSELASFAYDGVSSTKKINAQQYITPASFGDGSSTAGSFYFVVIDDEGKDIAYTTAAKTGTVNTGTGTLSMTVASSKFSYATAAVPEPTSAMLLLLGMAGLVLKRKRA